MFASCKNLSEIRPTLTLCSFITGALGGVNTVFEITRQVDPSLSAFSLRPTPCSAEQ